MPNYQNSTIYKLVSKQGNHNLIYIGSTTRKLVQRLCDHRNNFKKYKNNKYNYVSSFDLFEKGDVDIIELEKLCCKDKQELHARERHYIETLDCVNKIIPMRTSKEWYNDNKEREIKKRKEYYKKNRERNLKYQKDYYIKNKEKYQKKYQERKLAKANKKIDEIDFLDDKEDN